MTKLSNNFNFFDFKNVKTTSKKKEQIKETIQASDSRIIKRNEKLRNRTKYLKAISLRLG